MFRIGIKQKMYIKLINILLLLSYSLLSYTQTSNNNVEIAKILDIELKIVEKAYLDCISGPCYGDSIYFKNWLDGLVCEKVEDYTKARTFYKKAYDYPRFELSNYDIELSLGRLEMRVGNYSLGKEYLQKFIKNAKFDLDNQYMWGFTEEGKKQIRLKIDYAEKIRKIE
jgi:tetratricopeptide (TPR) repeat protein